MSIERVGQSSSQFLTNNLNQEDGANVMGHKNNNIYNETIEKLKSMQAFGQSKHQDKKDGNTQDKIYSYSTFKTYKEKCMDFIKMARREYKCKTLDEAKQYVGTFLQGKIEKGYSVWTIKLYASALGKLYQVPANSFIELPMRHRSDIVRSRRDNTVRSKHFSETKNKVLVDFCRSTGLRRSELESLKRKDCYEQDGKWYVYVESGKGGKSRNVECLDLPQACIDKIKSTKYEDRIFGKVSSAMDVHKLRAEFANAWYNKIARPIEDIPRSERYYCRGSMKGRVLDKMAMERVSNLLGHSRICVYAYSYAR